MLRWRRKKTTEQKIMDEKEVAYEKGKYVILEVFYVDFGLKVVFNYKNKVAALVIPKDAELDTDVKSIKGALLSIDNITVFEYDWGGYKVKIESQEV